jgi:hypothetical protein
MQWGRPQAETVRAYCVEVFAEGTWREVAREESNHQRRRMHRVEGGVRATALRIKVLATHGIDHARLFEVRAYG